MYQVISNTDFSGGLNLRDKSDVVKESEAIDILNVDLTNVGTIKQRDGYVKFTASALAQRVQTLFPYYTASGTKQLLAGCATSRLEAIDSNGVALANIVGLGISSSYSFTRFAAPGSELALVASSPAGLDTIRQWNGAAWSFPTATVNGTAGLPLPKASSICITPNTNRLVSTGYETSAASGPNTTTSNPSRVHFSNIGDPFTWETDGLGTPVRGRNFVDLTPGDGEQIMACIAWRDKVFVFKQSKFFVFEGEGTNNDATPIFKYRAVDTGVGLFAKQAVCASREGVFFMDSTGVYFTDGSDPIVLSGKIEPFWTGAPEAYFLTVRFFHSFASTCRMIWDNERIYLAVPTLPSTTNNRLLVYDIQNKTWTIYDIRASALTSWKRSDKAELHFGYATGTNDTALISSTATDDAGTVITSRWRSGWFDFGVDVEKSIRQCRLWGTGAVYFKLSKDFAASFAVVDEVAFGGGIWGNGTGSDVWGGGTDSSIVWGGGSQVTSAMNRSAIRGTVFSMEVSNVPGLSTWSLHRTARHIREQRPAGMYSA